MFFIIFIIIPLIEVILFIKVGQYIGLWNTISIIVITGIIGAILVRSQGISILKKGLEELQSNKLPLKPMLEAVAIVVAGAFLLTPGFLTDTLGGILLIPILRGKILEIFIKFFKKKIKYKATFYNQKTNNNVDNDVYEGKYEEIKDDDEKKE